MMKHVVAGGALAHTARCEAHAGRGEPLDRCLQIVDPQTHVVERRLVHFGLHVGIERLHEIDLDLQRTRARRSDVLVDVLRLAAEGPGVRQPEGVDPQLAQGLLAGTADRDLLDAEDLEGTRVHGSSSLGERRR
jgi:hypothetical protein